FSSLKQWNALSKKYFHRFSSHINQGNFEDLLHVWVHSASKKLPEENGKLLSLHEVFRANGRIKYNPSSGESSFPASVGKKLHLLLITARNQTYPPSFCHVFAKSTG